MGQVMNKINFTSFALRAKEQGEEILLFSRKPNMEIYSTVTDRHFADMFSEAMTFAAAKFAVKSNGRLSAEEVFNSLLKHCQNNGKAALSEVVARLKQEESVHASAKSKKDEEAGKRGPNLRAVK